jgi:glyoxylase-like metal-dependent hydrolase (beta-lactamase superfamily II)
MKISTYTCGPFGTNTYLVEDEASKEALLIDPTIGSGRVGDEIRARGLALRLIVNTHGHIDHVFGNAFFVQQTGAELAIHTDDAWWLGALTKQAATWGLDTPGAVQPSRLLNDGDAVAVGALSFVVLHTPGHSAGGVCLYGHGVLFAGDTLFAGGIGRTDLPGGDYDTLIDSIKRRLLTLPGETVVYSGHGEPTTIEQERQGNPFLA